MTDADPTPLTVVLKIINKRGLHARASAKFCALAGSWNADIRVLKDDYEVGACSIMGLLLLQAEQGSAITVSATGEQAQEALHSLARLVEDKFGEGE